MKISYVLPVYNAQNTIYRCLESLIKQEEKPHEIIIVNDGSTDNTKHLIERFCCDFNNRPTVIHIEEKERQGAAKCRNQGNELATGDIIAVCDADYYYKDRSTVMLEFFKTQKGKSIFYSALDLISAQNPHERGEMGAYEWDFNSKCPISHPTIAYTKQVSEEIKYHEDSKDTDLFEFFLLDAHKKGYLMGGSQKALMLKIEGDTKRDRSASDELKAKKYAEYGIKIA